MVRICSKCLITVMLASINRSTQLRMHGSSLRSRAPDEIFEVMHFLKQVSVRPWIAVGEECDQYYR